MNFLRILLVQATIIISSFNTASADSKIIAAVGEDVITQKDLKDRYKFFLIENSSVDIKNPKEEKALMHSILKSIIDEKILSQELHKYKISVHKSDVDDAISYIEESQKIGKGNFYKYVKSIGLSKEYAVSQIKKNILWEKFLLEVVSPQIHISENEMFEFISKNKPEALKVDYILASGSPSELAEVIIKTKSCKELQDNKKINQKHKILKLSKVDDYQERKAIIATSSNHPSYMFNRSNEKEKSFIYVCEKNSDQNHKQINMMLEQLRKHKIELQAGYKLRNIAKNKYIEVFSFE